MNDARLQIDEESAESEIIRHLAQIDENTRKSKFAIRAIAQLLIYPLLGTLIGGSLALFGYFNLQLGTPGIAGTLFAVGILTVIGFYLGAIIAATNSLRSSR